MRIRSRLLILVFAVLIPAVLGGTIGLGYIYTEQQQSYRSSIREVSRAMAVVLGTTLIAKDLGVTLSVSTGNEAASGVEDYVEHLIGDGATPVIGMIVEQFRKPAASHSPYDDYDAGIRSSWRHGAASRGRLSRRLAFRSQRSPHLCGRRDCPG